MSTMQLTDINIIETLDGGLFNVYHQGVRCEVDENVAPWLMAALARHSGGMVRIRLFQTDFYDDNEDCHWPSLPDGYAPYLWEDVFHEALEDIS